MARILPQEMATCIGSGPQKRVEDITSLVDIPAILRVSWGRSANGRVALNLSFTSEGASIADFPRTRTFAWREFDRPMRTCLRI